MAQLSESDRLFLAQRRERKHIGLFVVPGVLVLLVLIWAGLFLWWPTSVNPKAIWAAQERDELVCGSGNLSTYAVGAAILVNAAFMLLSAMLVLCISWARSERRYLKMIDKATLEPAAVAQPALPGPGHGSLRQ